MQFSFSTISSKLLSLCFLNFFTLILVHQSFGHRHSIQSVKIDISFLEAGDVGDLVSAWEVLFYVKLDN